MVITRLYTELAQSYMAHPCITFWEQLAWLVDSVGKILHFRLNQVSGGRDQAADLTGKDSCQQDETDDDPVYAPKAETVFLRKPIKTDRSI